ncbi:MAG: hypothetical protein JNJ58_04850 [Chitinophagaceae bacterium]|nr:hypothetical protein [Chitinophagaceae bacterium]
MKFALTILSIFILNTFAEWLLPWWILGIVCAAVCYGAKLSGAKSFLSGFVGIALSWLAMILWKDIPNHHTLAQRLAEVFSLKGNYPLFIVLNVLLGSLLGGLSGLAGRLWRS